MELSCPISLTSYAMQPICGNPVIFMPGEWASRRGDLDSLFPLDCPHSLALGQLTFPVELALLC